MDYGAGKLTSRMPGLVRNSGTVKQLHTFQDHLGGLPGRGCCASEIIAQPLDNKIPRMSCFDDTQPHANSLAIPSVVISCQQKAQLSNAIRLPVKEHM